MSPAIKGVCETGKLEKKPPPSSKGKFIGKTSKDLMTDHGNGPVQAGQKGFIHVLVSV